MQGIVVFAAAVFVLVNLLVDLIYPLLDPRIAQAAPPMTELLWYGNRWPFPRPTRRRRAGSGRVRFLLRRPGLVVSRLYVALVLLAAFAPQVLAPGDPAAGVPALTAAATRRGGRVRHRLPRPRRLHPRRARRGAVAAGHGDRGDGRAGRRRAGRACSPGSSRGWVDEVLMRGGRRAARDPAAAAVAGADHGAGLRHGERGDRGGRRERRELRPGDARGDAAGAAVGLRRGGARGRHPLVRHAAAARAAERGRPGAGARRAGVRARDPRGLVAVVPRLRRAAARPRVGLAGRRGPQLPGRGVVAVRDARRWRSPPPCSR